MINEIPSNEVNLEKPIAETTVEAPKEKFDGMSNRDALKESIAIHREGKESEAKTAPTTTEVTQAVNADLEPPQEFNATGKAAWKSKDIVGIQKEYRRIHDSRTHEITRAQTAEREAKREADKERAEAKTWRDLGKMAAPYIEARGAEGVTPDKAIMEALALINEFKKGDPATVKAELKKVGIDLDRAPTSTTQVLTPEIESLQKTVKELQDEREDRRFKESRQLFEQSFDTLTAQKTRSGESVFPDLLDNGEKGITLAKELGSLAKDVGFQSLVLRRFPKADFTMLVREAYIALGGKVSGEPATVSTKSNQQHIEKSRRASAAIPGRTAPRVNDSNLVGKLSNRAALMKAIEINREH